MLGNMQGYPIFISLSHLTLLFLLVWLFGSSCLVMIKPCSSSGDVNIVKCIAAEKQALLSFKEGLEDPSGRLSSWVGDNCCNWRGVRCNNKTGHVFKLKLRNPLQLMESEEVPYNRTSLSGKISQSLLGLKHLRYLDLSYNNFRGTHIPKFFGLLHDLRYLNLSFASFSGEVPSHLGNLSHLHYLDIGGSFFSNYFPDLYVENLKWLSDLSSLKYLDMGQVNFGRVGADWLHAVNMVPSLLELRLSHCQLESISLPFPSYVNFTSLSVFDISGNSINSSLPSWLFNLTSLTELDLSSNSFTGTIPHEFLGNPCNLRILNLAENNFTGKISECLAAFLNCPRTSSLMHLDLSSNNFVGPLPYALGKLQNLRHLDLSDNPIGSSIPASIGSLSFLQELIFSNNLMNGTIPESIGQLSELYFIYLEGNSFEGVITEAHFSNLTKLEVLVIFGPIPSGKSLTFRVNDRWTPPFSLIHILLENFNVGPKFPAWLQNQSQLFYLSLGNVGISDTIPGYLISNLSSQIYVLDLSHNQIKGSLPQPLWFMQPWVYINLGSNLLEGPLPHWFGTLAYLYLDNNMFTGPIPPNIGELMPNLEVLDISGNFLNGSIPLSLGKLKFLNILALKSNNLSGVLPHFWNELETLGALDLSNNSFSGPIPNSLAGDLHALKYLMLSGNNLEGELPSSLKNCKMLVSLDLGGNKLLGHMPLWIGEKLPSLQLLRLSSNLFSGELPQQLCHLSRLHILDLAQNNFTGSIPKCLDNLTALVYGNSRYLDESYSEYYDRYQLEVMISAKGSELAYSSTLNYLGYIDLSQNSLMGEIPNQITSLSMLGTLNLSMNHLNGSIPEKIGNLQRLETLDLSHNLLSGPIPQSLSSLTFLSHLNLSYNNLKGRIPSGNQLQTLNDSSIYEGNPLLCGVPLPTKCPGDDTSNVPNPDEGGKEGNDNEEDFEMLWFYVSMGPGFVVGFWGVCGTLLVKKRWRLAYFQFVDDIKDKIALMIALKVAAFRRRNNRTSRAGRIR